MARWSVGLALGLVLATAFAAPLQVAAECTILDPWPSFRQAARTAKTILIGQVVESLENDSADNAVWFRFRVDEVIRGQAAPVIEIKHLFSGVPIKLCDESILRVRINDRIAFAIDARVRGVTGRVTTVAWLRDGLAPTPSPAPGSADEQIESVRDFLVPGVERLAVSEVRALAALPATDTVEPSAESQPPQPALLVPLLVAASLAVVMLLGRLHERRSRSRV